MWWALSAVRFDMGGGGLKLAARQVPTQPVPRHGLEARAPLWTCPLFPAEAADGTHVTPNRAPTHDHPTDPVLPSKAISRATSSRKPAEPCGSSSGLLLDRADSRWEDGAYNSDIPVSILTGGGVARYFSKTSAKLKR